MWDFSTTTAATYITAQATPGAPTREMANGLASEMKSATPAQVLLRYSLQHGVVVIPKSSKPERIAESVGVFDISLSDAQMARLDALNDPRRGTAASVAEHLKIIAAKEYVKDRGSDGKT